MHVVLQKWGRTKLTLMTSCGQTDQLWRIYNGRAVAVLEHSEDRGEDGKHQLWRHLLQQDVANIAFYYLYYAGSSGQSKIDSLSTAAAYTIHTYGVFFRFLKHVTYTPTICHDLRNKMHDFFQKGNILVFSHIILFFFRNNFNTSTSM